ncbi:MAG: nickel-dependent lactate racemase [Thermoguttaceae bacterium]
MRIHLDYGRNGLDVDVPDRNLAGVLRCPTSEPLADPSAAVRRGLERPTGARPLAELARGRRNACVVISDVTRPVPNRVLLPPILETLEAAGIPPREILILVATGLHRPNLGDELVEMLGPDIPKIYQVENHHGRKLDEHTFLGDSPGGAPVWIDSRYVEADLKITTGLIEPHFMAGFSGGRKLICPGLAAFETIIAWHSPAFLEHPNACNGRIDGNPVHEEDVAIGRMAGCDFIVNVVIDASRRILHVAAGDMQAAHAEGVAVARRHVTATLPAPVDIVVTTSAGYPLDATFYQSVKGMISGLAIVKQGGTVILAAGLTEGIGSPEFQALFDQYPTMDAFMARLLKPWGGSCPWQRNGSQMPAAATSDDHLRIVDQWQLEEMAKVRRKATIKVVTEGLPPETLRRLFVEPAASVEAAIAEALGQHGPEATIAVIPAGPYVLAQLDAEPS